MMQALWAALSGDFFLRGLLAGLGVALVAGPLGCFVVWRRMVYFGDTLAHSALLGIGFGLLLEIDLSLAVGVATVTVALLLAALQRLQRYATDTLLGLLAHSALALGVMLVAFFDTLRLDLMGYLFGDVLAVGLRDLAILYATGAVLMAALVWLWRPLLAATINEDLARAEGLRVAAARLAFVVLVAGLIAVAMKVVGVLLITALLIIPAATARAFARSPETMAVLASLIAMAAVLGGLHLSLWLDTPSGPSVVVVALALFLATIPVQLMRRA